ncbi:DUF721 domain-containing protein [Brachybacterium hainanense]|uniref:DUF721 domain-containing protein n=1 Tax=Brachybacterium hainanense TaxID=1541174 RepID=A0ABV6REI1_9MICO
MVTGRGRAPDPYDLSTWTRAAEDPQRPSEQVPAAPDPAPRPAPVRREHAAPRRWEQLAAQAAPPVREREAPHRIDPHAHEPRRPEPEEDADHDPDPVDPPELPRVDDPFELARRTVNRSRAAARDRGLFPISRATQARDLRDRSTRAPGYSGARPDARDPQGIERVLRRVLGDLGWNEGMNAGRVLEEWDDIVGEQVSQHCRPVSLDEGTLVVSADSSAWATQLRMISSQLITTIEDHIGAHVITELKVTGPAARSWKKGRRTVTWRGPRDTYG